MTETSGTQRGSEQTADKTAIRPAGLLFSPHTCASRTQCPNSAPVSASSRAARLAMYLRPAAWEQTDYFVTEVRTALKSLR
jgi:hypothetical protein